MSLLRKLKPTTLKSPSSNTTFSIRAMYSVWTSTVPLAKSFTITKELCGCPVRCYKDQLKETEEREISTCETVYGPVWHQDTLKKNRNEIEGKCQREKGLFIPILIRFLCSAMMSWEWMRISWQSNTWKCWRANNLQNAIRRMFIFCVFFFFIVL